MGVDSMSVSSVCARAGSVILMISMKDSIGRPTPTPLDYGLSETANGIVRAPMPHTLRLSLLASMKAAGVRAPRGRVRRKGVESTSPSSSHQRKPALLRCLQCSYSKRVLAFLT